MTKRQKRTKSFFFGTKYIQELIVGYVRYVGTYLVWIFFPLIYLRRDDRKF